ncbi:hypothetical protein SERLA73DRAFT_182760 [Serpula lacrymans var. lacrymans S7.3]|uniref:DUF6534 domain-containing protein n=1 Tax=Serpula lacrymans var. lacrymans (strain S7.3) TaxID=936435 RepID=F8Q0X8_SERL3|nr:hypothetical protein SERLA73DRAFT_182760 [Serpula lacrymans var. lacrymans S7.3]
MVGHQLRLQVYIALWTNRTTKLYRQMTGALTLSYFIPFVVQIFYGHRVWIISAKNRLLTASVVAAAFVTLVLGLGCNIAGTINGPAVLFNTPLYAGSALSSVICDVFITGSVIFYLREGRSGIRRTETLVQQIIVMFVNMGVLTCVVSFITFVMYMTPQGKNYVGTTTTILSKCYVNSLLAILNARQSIRRRDRSSAFELPTLL